MSETKFITETREVKGFDQVKLKEYGELIITQGTQETISIDQDWIGQLSTHLTTRQIKYNLQLRNIQKLEISGAASVKAPEITADRLELKVSGAANVNIGQLHAHNLEVELPGTGNLDLAGQSDEQTVVVSGAGMYRASRLETQKTSIEITGLGKATVWATTDLDVTITGFGSVRYYGEPRVKRKIQGMGNLQGLGLP
jgi:glutamate synthase domain-containing protein 3